MDEVRSTIPEISGQRRVKPSTTNDQRVGPVTFCKDNIVRLDPRILAYLIPALLNRMEGQDLAELSSEIAKGLAPKDFRAINMQEYFNLRFTPDHPQMIRLINNGRLDIQGSRA